MKSIDDKWRWLESCLGIARVNAKMGYEHNARKYLTEARITAQSVKSWERLAEVYELSYLLSKSKGESPGGLGELPVAPGVQGQRYQRAELQPPAEHRREVRAKKTGIRAGRGQRAL
jgi:hypothetical protein